MAMVDDIAEQVKRIQYAIGRVREAERQLAGLVAARKEAETAARAGQERCNDRARRLGELLTAMGIGEEVVLCNLDHELVELATRVVEGERRGEVEVLTPQPLAEVARRGLEPQRLEQRPARPTRRRAPIRRRY